MGLFKLNDSVVDIQRCQITRNERVISVEPKVMDVLHILCEHSGEVVSQQELHERLWPGTTFNSSSIQRCIALLRKSLGEKANGSSIIITHPKRGYSIGVSIQPHTLTTKTSRALLKAPKVIFGLLGGFLLLVMFVLMLKPNGSEDLAFNQFTPLTSNSSNEYLPTYSSSGIYVAFVREGVSGRQQVLVKDLTTEKEMSISGHFSNLKSISWAYQDNGITIVHKEGTVNKIELFTFNPIAKLLAKEPLELFNSSDEIQSKVEWLSETDIIFAVKNDDQKYLILQYNIVQQDNVTVHQFSNADIDLIDIALSPGRTELAIALSEKGNQYPLVMLELASDKLSQLVTIENGIHSISWHPSGDSILISSREKLLDVSLAGDIEQIPISNYKMIKSASYSTLADQMIMELGSYDIDIIELKLDANAKTSRVVNTDALDLFPLYSPRNNQFVYQSNRRGFFQLFLKESGEERALFFNPDQEEFFGFSWSPDGEQIALATTHNIYIFDAVTFKEISVTPLEHKIYIRDWFNSSDALLVNVIVDEKSMPAKYYLNTGEVETFASISVSCSAIDDDDNVYYNHNNQIVKVDNNNHTSLFWHPEVGDIENIVVSKYHLTTQVNGASGSQYWQVELNTANDKSILKSLNQDLTISDISANGDSILFYSSFISKHELVVLSMVN